MTPERYHKIRQALERRQPDLTLITDQVHKGQNLAAMRRTCDAFAVGELHAVQPAGFEQRRHAGITAGTHKRVQLIRHASIEAAVDSVRRQGMRVVAADPDESVIDYRQYDFTRPVAILMGAERLGLSDAGKSLADDIVRIPMYGMVESLNVSVAFALIMSEACRQREAAGMFKKARLSTGQIDRLAFEWGYPRLKSHYVSNRLSYPALDGEGQIIPE